MAVCFSPLLNQKHVFRPHRSISFPQRTPVIGPLIDRFHWNLFLFERSVLFLPSFECCNLLHCRPIIQCFRFCTLSGRKTHFAHCAKILGSCDVQKVKMKHMAAALEINGHVQQSRRRSSEPSVPSARTDRANSQLKHLLRFWAN